MNRVIKLALCLLLQEIQTVKFYSAAYVRSRCLSARFDLLRERLRAGVRLRDLDVVLKGVDVDSSLLGFSDLVEL